MLPVRLLPRVVLPAAVLVVAVTAPAAAMPPPPDLMIVDARASAALSSWDRGRMRMYLQQNALACTLGSRGAAPRGEVRLVLDVTEKKPTRVKATARSARARPIATCLGRLLRHVQFPAPAPSWHWEGTLRFGGAHMEADVRESDGPIERLAGGRVGLENVVLAALEQPADCMDRYFSSPDEVSMVLVATLDTSDDGKLAAIEVKESTAVPEALVRCVRAQLDAIAIPVERPIRARLRIALLRPTTVKPGDDIPMIVGPSP